MAGGARTCKYSYTEQNKVIHSPIILPKALRHATLHYIMNLKLHRDITAEWGFFFCLTINITINFHLYFFTGTFSKTSIFADEASSE